MVWNVRYENFYLHGEKINIDGKHYLLTQNYAATAKEFGVNESIVWNIVKTPTRNGKLNDKGTIPELVGH